MYDLEVAEGPPGKCPSPDSMRDIAQTRAWRRLGRLLAGRRAQD